MTTSPTDQVSAPTHSRQNLSRGGALLRAYGKSGFADVVNVQHFYQRPHPYIAEIQSRRSRQSRILLFTLYPKFGHFGALCSQTKKVYGGMEIRYYEYHPCLPLRARSITPTNFTKDTSATRNAGPSPQLQTESRKSTCMGKVRSASRKP